jgi:hypothetical protein
MSNQQIRAERLALVNSFRRLGLNPLADAIEDCHPIKEIKPIKAEKSQSTLQEQYYGSRS